MFLRRRFTTRAGCAAAAGLLVPFAAPCQTGASESAAADEIVVTARKLPESIGRVPMSVQALAGEFLDRRDLSSLYDLQFEIPGLVVNNRGMFGAGLALRGVTDQGGSSLAIAPHVNGVYLGRSNAVLARQFDVERVEVVKGPQGTLYGRNATGGSMNVITRAPAEEFSAAVDGAFGSFNTARVEGRLNLPAEKLAVRIAGAASEGDGFIRNSVDERRFAEEDYRAMRAAMHARPTTALTIDIMGQRVEDDGASSELWLPRKEYLPDPNDIRLTTVTLDDPHLVATNDVASVDLAYALDRLTLRSITGYARSVTDALDDCAGQPNLQGCARAVRPLRYEQRSQELRLESATPDAFHWLLGAYYFDADETQRFQFSVPGIAPVPINDYTAAADETAYAVFGDASRALGAHWSASAGLRWSRDEQRVSTAGSGTADAAPAAAAGSWDDTSWRVGLEFSPRERTLVYANVSTGFRSGGVTTTLLPNGEFDGFDPEQVLAYEAGISLAFPASRSTLRASAFHYDFEGMQVRTVAVLATRVTSVIDNAAAARVQGLDVSATTSISERMTFTGGLVWLPSREFVEFIAASSAASLAGNKLSLAPEWSVATSLAYRVPIGNIGQLSADIDYRYRSEVFFTKENDVNAYQGDFGLLNLGLRFDARAGWHVYASARNVLDTDYFNQILIQSAPGQPARYEVGFGWHHPH